MECLPRDRQDASLTDAHIHNGNVETCAFAKPLHVIMILDSQAPLIRFPTPMTATKSPL